MPGFSEKEISKPEHKPQQDKSDDEKKKQERPSGPGWKYRSPNVPTYRSQVAKRW